VKKNITILKHKRYFNHVDWNVLQKGLKMTGLRQQLRKEREKENHQSVDKVHTRHVDTFKQMNEKILQNKQQKNQEIKRKASLRSVFGS
jgi:hypothetical protein